MTGYDEDEEGDDVEYNDGDEDICLFVCLFVRLFLFLGH